MVPREGLLSKDDDYTSVYARLTYQLVRPTQWRRTDDWISAGDVAAFDIKHTCVYCVCVCVCVYIYVVDIHRSSAGVRESIQNHTSSL